MLDDIGADSGRRWLAAGGREGGLLLATEATEIDLTGATPRAA